MIEKIWNTLQKEAQQCVTDEPLLKDFVHSCVLQHNQFSDSLGFILSNKLADSVMPIGTLQQLFSSSYAEQPMMIENACHDLQAIIDRDPAVSHYLTALLYLKGFQAIQIHRIAHHLWSSNRQEVALYLQYRNASVSSVDIHPAATIGKSVMFDHATGIVVGETAVIADGVSILQGVTLGGTGNDIGDRHPKVHKNVMIGAGAKVLGNIHIGEGAKIGAGSVVLKDVDAHTTVAGVPAVCVGKPNTDNPSNEMNQNIFDDSNE